MAAPGSKAPARLAKVCFRLRCTHMGQKNAILFEREEPTGLIAAPPSQNHVV
jgi:hypothetical protein